MLQLAVIIVLFLVLLWYFTRTPEKTENYVVKQKLVRHRLPNSKAMPLYQDQDFGEIKKEQTSDASLHRARYQRLDSPSGPSKIGIRDNSSFKDTEYLVFEKKLSMG